MAAGTGFATISLDTAIGAAGTVPVSSGQDAYTWTGASGGNWGVAANWRDATTAATATAAPGAGNAVTFSQNATIGGQGAAAKLTVSGAELALDGGGALTAGSATVGGTLQVGGGSTARVTGSLTLGGGTLLALAGSTVKLGGLVGNGIGNVIAVDANSSVAVGAPVAPANGALTLAAGKTIAMAGAIYGSVVDLGTIAVAAGGALSIDLPGSASSDPYAAAGTISGAGVLQLDEGSSLGLGVADSTAIRFAGPGATLQLAAIPTATISGFAAGDLITVDQTVTGLAYKQVTASTAQLTLTNGAAKIGTLNLAGSFGASTLAFHLDSAANGSFATISLQSIGVAAVQPTLIAGTAANDVLSATANGQTLSGLGGADTLNGNVYTTLDFKDAAANLNGSAIQNFSLSDVIDITDLASAKASVSYAGGVVSATDGTHTATFSLGFTSLPTTGSFGVASDGGLGSKLTWHA